MMSWTRAQAYSLLRTTTHTAEAAVGRGSRAVRPHPAFVPATLATSFMFSCARIAAPDAHNKEITLRCISQNVLPSFATHDYVHSIHRLVGAGSNLERI